MKMYIVSNKIKFVTAMLVMVGVFFVLSPKTYAATITVNSIDDTTVSADGNCTLREAIESANMNADVTSGDCVAGEPTSTAQDVINFNIAGSGVHVIILGNNFPSITEGATVNGYSQPGAAVNTAAYPSPLNTNLKIEIDTGISTSAAGFSVRGAPGTIIRGIAMYGGDYPLTVRQSPGTQIIGNFLGSHADGTQATVSDTTLGISDGSDDSWIGGELAAERNSIASNGSCLSISEFSDNVAQISSNNVTVAGNFIGIAPDGTSRPCGSGGVSIKGSSSTRLGLPTETGGNIVVANGLTVETSSSDNPANNNRIRNNHVGTLADGVTSAGNSVLQIMISGDGQSTEGNIIGGSQPREGNIIIGNSSSSALLVLTGSTKTVIRGNNIGVNKNGVIVNGSNGSVVAVVGGSENILGGIAANDANIIGATNTDTVVTISDLDMPLIPMRLTASKMVVLGNTYLAAPSVNLIDLLLSSDTDGDFTPDTFTNQGPTPNDIGDVDTGANNYINTPVINSVEQNGPQAVVNFDLDAADSPSDEYRIEFFAKSASDPTRTVFIGSTTTGNGNAQQTSFNLPSGLNLAGQSVMATTTAVDGATDSGFGATSEFSMAQAVVVVSSEAGPGNGEVNLASTGQIQVVAIVAAGVLFLGGLLTSAHQIWRYKH